MESTPGLNAAASTITRAVLKAAIHNAEPTGEPALKPGILGNQYILPPLIGEMGGEIRHHMAKVLPWLNNGWRVMSRFPAFYPEGTAIYNEAFFQEIDDICHRYLVIGAYGAIYIPPRHNEKYHLQLSFQEKRLEITCTDWNHLCMEAVAETELRKVFLKWFYTPDRHISDYDHYVLSFASTVHGNSAYYDGYALLPDFKPPAFLNPPEAIPPHVGVQIRQMKKTLQRNSDPQWMLQTASAIAKHLGLEVIVYGHANGCYLPESGYRCTWDATRPKLQHMEHELGYLNSCRLMLAPDSGWADLMIWLGVPTFLEKLHNRGELTPYRHGIKNFQPRIRIFDRSRSTEDQTDALLNDPPWDLPPGGWYQEEDPKQFPYLP